MMTTGIGTIPHDPPINGLAFSCERQEQRHRMISGKQARGREPARATEPRRQRSTSCARQLQRLLGGVRQSASIALSSVCASDGFRITTEINYSHDHVAI